MKKDKNAFTMIEMVFVIVILGILAAIAIPKMVATRTDAEITKGRADIASIRSAIITERQGRLIQGQSGWITQLSQNTTTLFDGNGSSTLLMYGITAGTGSGHWTSTDGSHYTFKILDTNNTFTYTPADGKFECTAGAYCSSLVD
ncbi:MAG: type II secretion system protein [Sulfurimonas sp.]|jgi:general secretion pathway protein G